MPMMSESKEKKHQVCRGFLRNPVNHLRSFIVIRCRLSEQVLGANKQRENPGTRHIVYFAVKTVAIPSSNGQSEDLTPAEFDF